MLDAVVDERKNNCFVESDGAFCGNKIVEDGEECDCGFDDDECSEQCCHPRVQAGSADGSKNHNSCRLRKNAECSPSVGPCCTDQCTFIPKSRAQQCKEDQDCTEKSFCDGTAAVCPKPDKKEDNRTECNGGTQVCQQGDCKGSICLKFGMEQCFLSSADKQTTYNTRALCELACQEPGRNTTCKSTEMWVASGEGRDRNMTDRKSVV